MASQEGLVDLHVGPLPQHGLRIERGLSTCACSSENIRLIVYGRYIVCRSSTLMAFPHYGIPDDCTPEEQVTIVSWLTRQRFLSFASAYENNNLGRFLAPNRTFRTKPSNTCSHCEIHYMEKDPVFCLKSIVLSALNKGPTLESVLDGQ
ncbi:hypothetical protein JTE90_022624 [Oedothorax gibbosus]|uniref:Uncharacterized protein n=1 Tax=Oedothorax gibbosus TaxID=931172 RepID=A0AAV6TUR1_9ARAC|nr:hypothetical protein JTE90_022624 [Oedothorax gibbosus]